MNRLYLYFMATLLILSPLSSNATIPNLLMTITLDQSLTPPPTKDLEQLVSQINHLAQEIESLQTQWQNEKMPAKKQILWRNTLKKIKQYNRLLQKYETMKDSFSRHQQKQPMPEKMRLWVEKIRAKEKEIFQLQKQLNQLFTEYQSLLSEPLNARRRVLEEKILRLRAQKDQAIADYRRLIKEFTKKYPDIQKKPRNLQSESGTSSKNEN